MNVLLTGGMGALGRHVVTQLRSQGHRVRILTRSPKAHVDAIQGDLTTGAGLAKAVGGMDRIIHAASATTQLTKATASMWSARCGCSRWPARQG
jgi:nucleoside-diphosphate-sugar epimerase